MISERRQAYIWAWLPGQSVPVVAAVLRATEDSRLTVTYGRSYLGRQDAIPIYEPELPLSTGPIPPPRDSSTVAGCIRDAAPDAWGQRVIERRLADAGRATTGDELPLLTYLLESGSDRIGALDFQASATEHIPRSSEATLAEMVQAAALLQAGEVLTADLDAALLHGTSVGGARPKVLLDDNGRHLIAKLSSTTDPYPVVRSEAAAMDLAGRTGISTPATEVTSVLGHDVLLVERFDRVGDGGRRMMVSALTVAGEDELFARYVSYWRLADIIRDRFTSPGTTLRELFSRITFNICVSNTDDHAKNHAAFWDGRHLTLTPAYDVCPSPRSGGETVQAMAIGTDGWRYSQLAGCIDRAGLYGLSRSEAKAIIDHQIDTITSDWADAAERARLTGPDAAQLWGHQILNPYCLYDYPRLVAVPDVPPDVAAPARGSGNIKRSAAAGADGGSEICGAPTSKGGSCRRRGDCPYHGR